MTGYSWDRVSQEVEKSEIGASRYVDDLSYLPTSPDGYWEAMEATGLKKRKAVDVTPKKSLKEIVDEALWSLAEHSCKMDNMVAYLQESPHSSKKKF